VLNVKALQLFKSLFVYLRLLLLLLLLLTLTETTILCSTFTRVSNQNIQNHQIIFLSAVQSPVYLCLLNQKQFAVSHTYNYCSNKAHHTDANCVTVQLVKFNLSASQSKQNWFKNHPEYFKCCGNRILKTFTVHIFSEEKRKQSSKNIGHYLYHLL